MNTHNNTGTRRRRILTPISDRTNDWIVTQYVRHAKLYGRPLSAAALARAVLLGCAQAQVPLGDLPTEEDIVYIVADVFRQTHATNAAQQA